MPSLIGHHLDKLYKNMKNFMVDNSLAFIYKYSV